MILLENDKIQVIMDEDTQIRVIAKVGELIAIPVDGSDTELKIVCYYE